MNIKENKTYQTARNKAQIRRKQEGREGCTPRRNYMVQTTFPEKNKKISKNKNFKCNYIQNYTLSKLKLRPFST